MRILIIEDHQELANAMKVHLMKEKYCVDVAHTGLLGEEKAFVNSYDIILLDLNLPDKDGLEILRFLREQQVDTPVLILTARDGVDERSMGLDAGADDYLGKPFQYKELSSRIRAVIRRYHGRSNPLIILSKLCIDPARRQAFWEDVLIPLSVKEFDTLEYLASRHPAIVSNEELAEHLYDEDFDPFSSVMRVNMTRLRKKLNQASKQELLGNLRGKGYYLCIK